jgi:uncharacterized membrane protein YdjX (TVP38/TMEM64 family)
VGSWRAEGRSRTLPAARPFIPDLGPGTPRRSPRARLLAFPGVELPPPRDVLAPGPTLPGRGRLGGAVRALLVGGVIAALAVSVLRRPGWILEALLAAREAGAVGRLGFVLVYVVAGLLMLPAGPITVGAGHAFGPLVGVLVAAPATCLASCLPFLLGRTLLRGPVSRRLARVAEWPLLAEAIRRSGFQVVALLRATPVVPFPVLNYLMGATPLRLRDFAAGSLVGMLPGTIAYAWLGSLLPDPRQAVQGVTFDSWGALAGVVVLTAVVGLLARRALRRALGEARAALPPA